MLILIFLSNSFFKFLHENEKWTVFRFPFFYENEKRMRALKIRSKNLLNMKMEVNYLNFVFHNEVKVKSSIELWISLFNLSKTRNGTLGKCSYFTKFSMVTIKHIYDIKDVITLNFINYSFQLQYVNIFLV